MPEGTKVNAMFAGIAERYDFANRILSGGMDVYWRNRLVKAVKSSNPKRIVDLATGSGDVAFAIANGVPDASITGMDFCEPMLDEARGKQDKLNSKNPIEFTFGDCLNLPLQDGEVDVLTISFGFRNLEDRAQGLKEMRRVLNPNGGRLLILEFTQPWPIFRPIYYAYLKTLLPIFAKWATGNRSAYDYLVGSIESFPSKESLKQEIEKAGFSKVSYKGMTASVVSIHEAVKNS